MCHHLSQKIPGRVIERARKPRMRRKLTAWGHPGFPAFDLPQGRSPD